MFCFTRMVPADNQGRYKGGKSKRTPNTQEPTATRPGTQVNTPKNTNLTPDLVIWQLDL